MNKTYRGAAGQVSMTVPHSLPNGLPGTDRQAGAHNYLPEGTRFDEFEVRGLVGEGGFSVVYRAFDHQLEREVAIKEYMPSSIAFRGSDSTVRPRPGPHEETYRKGLDNFIDEARLLARFEHPSLVKVHRFWSLNGTAYMVMPLYQGETLRNALRKMPGPPSEAWFKRMLAPLLDALASIHAQNCYHRDIAPDNILILEHDQPVLLDFGAARRVIGDITQALTVILKPGFAPLEQYADDSSMKQGPWTDLYALGAVIHYCATGRAAPPSVSRVLRDTLEPLAKAAPGLYSQSFSDAVEHAMQVRIEDRTQSVAQLRAELGLDRQWEPSRLHAPAAGANPGPVVTQRPGSAALHSSDYRTEDPDATVDAAFRSSAAQAVMATNREGAVHSDDASQPATPASPDDAAAPDAQGSDQANAGAVQHRRSPVRWVIAVLAGAVLVGSLLFWKSRQDPLEPLAVTSEAGRRAVAQNVPTPDARTARPAVIAPPASQADKSADEAQKTARAEAEAALAAARAATAQAEEARRVAEADRRKADVEALQARAEAEAIRAKSKGDALKADAARTAITGKLPEGGLAPSNQADVKARPASDKSLAAKAEAEAAQARAALARQEETRAVAERMKAELARVESSRAEAARAESARAAPARAASEGSRAARTKGDSDAPDMRADVEAAKAARPQTRALDLAASAAAAGRELGGGSVLRFNDRAVRLPDGEWRVQASGPMTLDYSDPGGTFGTQNIPGWSVRLTQMTGGKARSSVLLMLSTESGQQFERLLWGDEFCGKSRPRSLGHDFNGSYNQPVCWLVQKVGNPAEALGSRLSAMMGAYVREGDYLLSYGNHFSANYLRVLVVVSGDAIGSDVAAVALGRALAAALRPLGEFSSRTVSLPKLPD